MAGNTFSLWAFGDAHVGTDIKRGRHSLAEALRTSERGGSAGGPAFAWDIAIDIGDMSGGQEVPDDDEGADGWAHVRLPRTWRTCGRSKASALGRGTGPPCTARSRPCTRCRRLSPRM